MHVPQKSSQKTVLKFGPTCELTSLLGAGMRFRFWDRHEYSSNASLQQRQVRCFWKMLAYRAHGKKVLWLNLDETSVQFSSVTCWMYRAQAALATRRASACQGAACRATRLLHILRCRVQQHGRAATPTTLSCRHGGHDFQEAAQGVQCPAEDKAAGTTSKNCMGHLCGHGPDLAGACESSQAALRCREVCTDPVPRLRPLPPHTRGHASCQALQD